MDSKRCLQRLTLCLAMALVPAVCQADFIRILSEHTTLTAAVRDEAGAVVASQSYAGESWNQPLTSSSADYSDGRHYVSAVARFDAYSPYVYPAGTGRYYWVAASLTTATHTAEATNTTDWLFQAVGDDVGLRLELDPNFWISSGRATLLDITDNSVLWNVIGASWADFNESNPRAGTFTLQDQHVYALSASLAISTTTGDPAGAFRLETNADVVPEPASLLLVGTGLAGLAGRAWRKRRGQVGRAGGV